MIDVSPLVAGDERIGDVAAEIDRACREFGFFYVEGHGVDEDLQQRMDAAARAFFALPEADKAEIAMARGGRAWRGWFPFEGELTSGRPDRKEGIYFGEELPADDPRVARGTPLHGAEPVPDAGARAARRRAPVPRRHDGARPPAAAGAWRWASAWSRAGSTSTSPPIR